MLFFSLLIGCGAEQQLGRDITPGSNEDVRGPVWSADGSEIFFIAGNTSVIGLSSIKAAKADGSGVRVVDDNHESYGQLWGPPDGSALYFTAFTFDATTVGAVIFEVFQAQRITDIDGGTGTFVASPTGGKLAYTTGSTVSLFDPGAGWSTPQADDGNWWSIAFSPAGDQLFLVSPTEGRTIDLSGVMADTRPLALELNWASAIWVDDGIRILSGAHPFASRYRIQSLATGADLQIPVSYSVDGSGWSRDARQVALWGNSCRDYIGFSCSSFQSALYVTDAASGQTKEIAHGQDLGGGVAFSPDGSHVAYVFRKSLYVSDAPQP